MPSAEDKLNGNKKISQISLTLGEQIIDSFMLKKMKLRDFLS